MVRPIFIKFCFFLNQCDIILSLSFCLLVQSGVLFGRQSLTVRVCSSPGRDVVAEENKISSTRSVKEEAFDFSPEPPIGEAEQRQILYPEEISPEMLASGEWAIEVR